MFGCMRAGVVPVPVNTRQGHDVLDYIVDNSDAVGVIAEPAANAHVMTIGARRDLALRVRIGEGAGDSREWLDFDRFRDGGVPPPPTRLDEDALCFLSYTSGSTGRPKGVPLTHAGQVWWTRALLQYWPPAENARSLIAVPLYHKNAMAGAVKPRLGSGGAVVLMPEFNARSFLNAAARYRVTGVSGVPTVFTLLLEEEDLLKELDLSALETAVVGAAPVHEELEKEMAEKLGVSVMQSYGLTEGGPVMLGPALDGRATPRGSAGVAWPEGEVKLVNDHGEEDDHDGELWVKNPGVPDGYLNLPEVNAQRYVDGFLRTGDLFHRDSEGFFYFRGRVDDMFNCGGENVYPKEVENLLLGHADVVDVCVVALEHRTKGHAPAALVVVREDARVDEAALKTFTIENGPAYAHPRRLLLQTAPLPLTGARKVDRSNIRKHLAERIGTLGD